MANSTNSPEINPTPFQFQELATPVRCSSLTCPSGHTWPIEIQVTQCPGCKSPILAIKMVNCPQCNEPSATLSLRADHLSRGQAITPICAGSASQADVHQIELKLCHAQLEAENHVVRQLPAKI